MEDNKPLTVNYQGTEHTSVKVKMSAEEFALFNNATEEERKTMALEILQTREAKAKHNLQKRLRLKEKRTRVKKVRKAQRIARRGKR